MNRDRAVTFKMPEELLSSALAAARSEEMTAGEFIRTAVAERVADLSGGTRDPVGVLRRTLRRHFADAKDWPDLQRRLRAEKFVLRDVSGELWLHTWPVERRLVPLARMGVTREDLTLLYRARFPAFGARVLVFARRVLKAA